MTWPIFRRGLPLFLGLLFLGLTAGCGKSTEDSAEKEPPPAPVKVASPVETALAEWTELLGTPQPLPNHAARITAAVEGSVLRVLQDDKGKPLIEGQKIDKGQVVLQLDDRVAKANRDKLTAGQEDMKETLTQADLAVDVADINLKSLERLQTGVKPSERPVVPAIEMEKARITLKDAQSKQRSVLAKMEASKAELKAVDEQLDLFTLRAPINGRLGLVQVVPGQHVAAGTVIAEIVDLEEVDVICFVPPKLVGRLKVDQPAKIVSNDEEAKGPIGKVVYVAVQAQPETGNFAVKIRFPNTDLKIRGNTVVRMLVQTEPEKKRWTIPIEALMEDRAPPTVVVVETGMNEKTNKEETHSKQLEATVGVRDYKGLSVEILGLRDPDPEKRKEKIDFKKAVFVIEGGYGLKDDDLVKIEEEEKKEEDKKEEPKKEEDKKEEKK